MFTLAAVLLAAEPEALTPAPDEAQAERISLDAQRVKRFVGALVGGAVALAIPLAISAPNCVATTTCSTSFQNFSLGIMPLVAGLGAYFGHHLFGGEAEYPFAALTAGLGSLIGMLTLLFANAIGVAPTGLLPYAGAAAGLTTFLMAFVLDTRDQRIGDLPADGHATGARLWASFGAAVGVGIAGSFISFLVGLLNPYVGLVCGLGVLAAIPAVSWGVHNALGGHGSLGSAFLGLLVSLAAVAALGLPAILSAGGGFSSISSFYLAQQGALITGAGFLALLAGPLVGLEMSHSEAVRDELRPSFSLAPINGGAMAGAGFRF